ncbi:hypothetical protein ABPG75_009979 [Micractinium tetrahymenae]
MASGTSTPGDMPGLITVEGSPYASGNTSTLSSLPSSREASPVRSRSAGADPGLITSKLKRISKEQAKKQNARLLNEAKSAAAAAVARAQVGMHPHPFELRAGLWLQSF